MTDNIGQLHQNIDNLGQFFVNLIGMIEQLPNRNLNPAGSESKEDPPPLEEDLKQFSKNIVFCSKAIDELIETLPEESITEERQLEELESLEIEKERIDKELEEKVKESEKELLKVRQLLQLLAKEKLANVDN